MGAKRPLSSRNPLSPKVAARLIRESSSLLDLLTGIARLRGWRGAASILSSKKVRNGNTTNVYVLLANPLFEAGAGDDIWNYFYKISKEEKYQTYYFPATKRKMMSFLINKQ